MAVLTGDLSSIYDEFLTKGLEKLTELQKNTQMEDESLARASSNIIIGAMQSSTRALEVFKKNELINKDLLIKDQQLLSSELQNGGVSFTYTYYVAEDQEVIDGDKEIGDVKTKTLVVGDGKSIYELQQEKLKADTEFVNEQKLQLGFSVVYNNRIKSLENYSDMIGNLGIGGFVISSDMWGSYFTMINDIYINSGDVPVDKSITTPTDLALTKP